MKIESEAEDVQQRFFNAFGSLISSYYYNCNVKCTIFFFVFNTVGTTYGLSGWSIQGDTFFKKLTKEFLCQKSGQHFMNKIYFGR